VGGVIGGGKSAPAPPDFTAVAEREARLRRELAQEQLGANRPSQTNPWGASIQWSKTPGGEWAQQQTLGGELGTASEALQKRISEQAGAEIPGGEAVRQQAIEAVYGEQAAKLDPQWAQRAEALTSQLAAQGLGPESEAYKRATQSMEQERANAYTQARNEAIQSANQAQALTFQQNLAARQVPLSELGQLRAFTEMPGFAPAAGVQGPELLQAAGSQYGAGMQQYGANQALKQSKLSGAASAAPLVPTALGAGGVSALEPNTIPLLAV